MKGIRFPFWMGETFPSCRELSLFEVEIFPCWRRKKFPVGWVKHFPLEGKNIFLLVGKHFSVELKRERISLLEGERFPCWRGKSFPVG